LSSDFDGVPVLWVQGPLGTSLSGRVHENEGLIDEPGIPNVDFLLYQSGASAEEKM
jgi:hypothetical protein